MRESLEQTLINLRERVTFLERANGTLSADRLRAMKEFERCEEILGGLSGLSLSGALAARLCKIGRREADIERRESMRRLTRHDKLAMFHPRDTGVIGDDV